MNFYQERIVNTRMSIEQARENMLKQQLRTWNVLDEGILELFNQVPREFFVPEPYKQLAFADISIPIGQGQTMMPPKEEARILQALKVLPHEKILVLGTGAGYLPALLAKQGKWVYSVDSIDALTTDARLKLQRLHIDNVTLITDDTTHIWDKESPYDVIVITGSLPYLPHHFQQSLQTGGRLFAILGDFPAMEATLIHRLTENEWQVEKIFETLRERLANFKEPEHFVF